MKISIVTPVYNDVRVERALSSILNQSLNHELETIVMDAGSTDGTLDILARFRDQITILVSEPDGGVFDGMNKGVARATGDVIGILNADDLYHDTHVLRDVTDVFQQQDPDICYGNILYLNRAGRQVRYFKAGQHHRFKWRLGWMPPHPAFFAKRSAYERHGLYNPELVIAADYELMLRLLFKHRLKSAYIDRVLARMATGGVSNGSVAGILEGAQDVRAAWKVNELRGGHLASFLKPTRKLEQFLRRAPGTPQHGMPMTWEIQKGGNPK